MIIKLPVITFPNLRRHPLKIKPIIYLF